MKLIPTQKEFLQSFARTIFLVFAFVMLINVYFCFRLAIEYKPITFHSVNQKWIDLGYSTQQ